MNTSPLHRLLLVVLSKDLANQISDSVQCQNQVSFQRNSSDGILKFLIIILKG